LALIDCPLTESNHLELNVLTISQMQMDLLSSSIYARVETAMTKHARETFPEKTQQASNLQLSGAIRFVVEQGNTYGIVLQEDIRRFMELFFSHGPDFLGETRFAPLLNTLQRDDLSGTAKMNLIDMLEPALVVGGRA
jgi:hypothetical protein